MSKKSFDRQVQTTIDAEDRALQARLEKVDSVLLARPLPVKNEKAKSSVIRDTFSMPPDDYELIDQLRTRAALLGHIVTKSEVIRAGLHALTELEGDELLKAITKPVRLQPGRKI